MRKGKKKSFRTLTNVLELGIGWNLEGMEDFDEKKRLGLREKRWISRYFSEKWIRVEPRVYIDPDISIDRGGIERCQEQKIDRSRGNTKVLTAKRLRCIDLGPRRCRADREFRNFSWCIEISIETYREKPRKSQCIRECVELLSSNQRDQN